MTGLPLSDRSDRDDRLREIAFDVTEEEFATLEAASSVYRVEAFARFAALAKARELLATSTAEERWGAGPAFMDRKENR